MKLSERIAISIGIDEKYVYIISKRNRLYFRYYIDKKGGGKREILQPSKELKVLQRWISRNILCSFPVSQYSYAYSKGCSIRGNALAHKDGLHILHTDIVDFFPSINRDMLIEYFKNNWSIVNGLGLSWNDIGLILDICLYKGENLVVGGVASPHISNLVMYDFDMELKKELDQISEFNYTRYADDIIISSRNFIDNETVNMVKNLINKYGFDVNDKKTYFMSKNSKRQITGVVIDNNVNKLSIGNKKYKMIERMIYNYLIKDDGDLDSIKGYLAYVKDINEQQYNQIANIYSKYDIDEKIFGK